MGKMHDFFSHTKYSVMPSGPERPKMLIVLENSVPTPPGYLPPEQ